MGDLLFASSIATTYDVGGRSYAAWDENGQLLIATWDNQAQRWNNAMPIGNAGRGRNLRLTGGPLLAGGELPALVASWESGQGNDSAVYLALGTYQPNGSLRWSDAVRLGQGGVSYSNHQIGLSDKGEIVVTAESQLINAETYAPETAPGETKQKSAHTYHDKEITTFKVSPVRTFPTNRKESPSGRVYRGEPLELEIATAGSTIVDLQVNGSSLGEQALNGTEVSLKDLGTFQWNPQSRALRFDNQDRLESEIVITLTEVEAGSLRRRSYVIQPQGRLANGEKTELSLRVYRDDNEAYSTIPLSFANAERAARASSSTFQAFVPRSQGFNPRELNGTGIYSDSAIKESFAQALEREKLLPPQEDSNDQPLVRQNHNESGNQPLRLSAADGTSTAKQADEGGKGFWGMTGLPWEQFYGVGVYPFVLYPGQVDRFEVSFGDITQAMMGNTFTLRAIGDYLSPILQISFGGSIGMKRGVDDQQQANEIRLDSSFYLQTVIETGIGGGAGKKQANSSQNTAGLAKYSGYLGRQNILVVRGVHSGISQRYTKSRKELNILKDSRDIVNLYVNNPDYENTYIPSDLRDATKRAEIRTAVADNNAIASKWSQAAYCQQADWGFTAGYMFGIPGLKGFRLGADAYQRYLQRGKTLQPAGQRWEAYLETLWGVGYQARLGTVGRTLMPVGWEGGPDSKENQALMDRYSGAHYTRNDSASLMWLNAQTNLDVRAGIYGGRTYTNPRNDPSGKPQNIDLDDLPLILSAENGFRSAEIRPPFNWGKTAWTWLKLAAHLGVATRALATRMGDFNEDAGFIGAILPDGRHNYGFKDQWYQGMGLDTRPLAPIAKTDNYNEAVNQNVIALQVLNGIGGVLEKFAEIPWWDAARRVLVPGSDYIDKYYQDYSSEIGLKWGATLSAELSLFNRGIGGYGAGKANGRIPFQKKWDPSVQVEYEAGWIFGGIRQSTLSASYNLTGNDLPVSGSLQRATQLLANGQDFPKSTVLLKAKAYEPIQKPNGAWQPGDLLIESVVGILPGTESEETTENAEINQILWSNALLSVEGPALIEIEGVLRLPSVGDNPEDRLRALNNVMLYLQGKSPAQLWVDRRALAANLDAALNDSDPWQLVVDGFSGDGSQQQAQLLQGMVARSNQPVPFKLLVLKGSDEADDSSNKLEIGMAVSTTSLNDGKVTAFPIEGFSTEMPGVARLRNDEGSGYLVGLDVGDLNSPNLVQTENPYVGAIIVTNGGANFQPTDFVYVPETGGILHGRLIVDTNGVVEQVELLNTGESEVYKELDTLTEDSLQVRLPDSAGGRNAVIIIRPPSEPNSAGEVSNRIAILDQGAGYLGGTSGEFTQRLQSKNGSSVLVSLMVHEGRILAVNAMEPIEGFADDGERLELRNEAKGDGDGLQLFLIKRDRKELNFIDETHNRVSGATTWSDNTFKSNIILSYTQMGHDASKSIVFGNNVDLDFNFPLVTKLFDRPNSGWNELGEIIPDQSGYTPGIHGYNHHAVVAPIHQDSSANKRRQLMVFAHSDMRAIKNEDDLYLLPSALQRSKLYYSLYDNKNWGTPIELPGQQVGVNNSVILEPWQAINGVGIKPILGASNQVLAAWVATNDEGNSSIQASIGSIKDNKIVWQAKPSVIQLPEGVESSNVTRLSLTYLDERTPVLSWSLDTKAPYALTVYEDEPEYYYRLDDIDSPLLSTGTSNEGLTGVVPLSALKNYSSPFSEESKLNENAPAFYGRAGALERAIGDGDPGDHNAAMSFGGGEFVLASNPKTEKILNAVSKAENNADSVQPINPGYGIEFWVQTNPKDQFASLVDEGLYRSDAVLPSADQILLPIGATRVAETDSQGRKGYLYTIYLPKQSAALISSNDGVGSGLSPLALNLIGSEEIKQEYTFKDGKKATLTIPKFDYTPFLDKSLVEGRLTGVATRENHIPIQAEFVVDDSSPGRQDNTEMEVSQNVHNIQLTTTQTPGWSIRKYVVDEVEKIVYTYGETIAPGSGTKTPLTLTGELKPNDWNHIYAAYSNKDGGVAELYVNGKLAERTQGEINSNTFKPSTSQVAIAYAASAKIDELAFYGDALEQPVERLQRRLEARYVDPSNASKNTFYSEAQYTNANKIWEWSKPNHFSYINIIPGTTPAAVQNIGVDATGAGVLNGVGPDGQADVRYSLALRLDQDLKAGTRLRGMRVTLGNGQQFVIGKGPSELYREEADVDKGGYLSANGLIAVTSQGTLLNSGANKDDLDFAVMAGQLVLDIYLQAGDGTAVREKAKELEIIKAEVWLQSPDEVNKGVIGEPVLVANGPFQALSSKTNQTGQGNSNWIDTRITRATPLSLAEFDTGITYHLIPASQTSSGDKLVHTLAVSRKKHQQIENGSDEHRLALSLPELTQIDGSVSSQIWILPIEQKSETQKLLGQINSLRGNVKSILNSVADLKAICILGPSGQVSGEKLLWADLDGDGNDELIIGNPSAHDQDGEVIIISGQHIEDLTKRSSGYQRVIDLNEDAYSNTTANKNRIIYFRGSKGSALGTSLAAGSLFTNSQGLDLAIGAPLESVEDEALGAVYTLRSSAMFGDEARSLEILATGILKDIDKSLIHSQISGIDQRFGESLSIIKIGGNEALDDLLVGVPGFTPSFKIKKGKNEDFSQEIYDALTRLRSSSGPNSDPPEQEYVMPTSGGIVLLKAEDNYNMKKGWMLRTDSPTGEDSGGGIALATGDFDGDGIDDLTYGLSLYDNKAGAVALISGKKLRDATQKNDAGERVYQAFANASLFIPGLQSGEQLGRYLALEGSLNGDKESDLVIGNPESNEKSGVVHVVFGEKGLLASKKESNSEFVSGDLRIHELDQIDPQRRLDIKSGTSFTKLGQAFAIADVNETFRNKSGKLRTTSAADLILVNSETNTDLTVIWGQEKLEYTGKLSVKDLASGLGIEFASGTPVRNMQDLGLIGDVNGDGYADALIGITSQTNGNIITLAFGSADDTASDHPDAGVGGQASLDLTPKFFGLGNNGQEPQQWAIDQVSTGALKRAAFGQALIVSVSNTESIQQAETEALVATKTHWGVITPDIGLSSNALFQTSQTLQWVDGVDQLIAKNRLVEGESLKAGERLISADGSVQAVMDDAGRFRIYRNTRGGIELLFDLTNLSFYPNQRPIRRTRVVDKPVPGSHITISEGYLLYVRPDGTSTKLSSVDGELHQPDSKNIIYTSTSIQQVSPDPNRLAQTEFVLSNQGSYTLRQGERVLVKSYNPNFNSNRATLQLDPRDLNRFEVIGAIQMQFEGSDIFPPLAGSLVKINGKDINGKLALLTERDFDSDVVMLLDEFKSLAENEGQQLSGSLSEDDIAKILAIDISDLKDIIPYNKEDTWANRLNLESIKESLDLISPSITAAFAQYVANRNPAYALTELSIQIPGGSDQKIMLSESQLTLADANGDGHQEIWLNDNRGQLFRIDLNASTILPAGNNKGILQLKAEQIESVNSAGFWADDNSTESAWQDGPTVMKIHSYIATNNNYDTKSYLAKLPNGTLGKSSYPLIYEKETGRYRIAGGDYQEPILSYNLTETGSPPSSNQINNTPVLQDPQLYRKASDGEWVAIDDPTSVPIVDLNNKRKLFEAKRDYTYEPILFNSTTISNGQYLDQPLLHLVKPYINNSSGTHQLDLTDRLTSSRLATNKSWEIKIPSLVYAKPRSTVDGSHFALHLGSSKIDLESSAWSGTTQHAPTAELDGFALIYDQGKGNLRVVWNGQTIWTLGQTMSEQDISYVTNGREDIFRDNTNLQDPFGWLKSWLRPSDYMPGNNNTSSSGDLWNMAIYARYQEPTGAGLPGTLILQISDATMVKFRESGQKAGALKPTIRGIDVAIPIENSLQLSGEDNSLRVTGRTTGTQYAAGVQAIRSYSFNDDLPANGLDLLNLTSVGDLNGDGFDDLIGASSLALGWNYLYTQPDGKSVKAADLARANVKDHTDGIWDDGFPKNRGAFASQQGDGLYQHEHHAAVILWGGLDGISLERSSSILPGKGINNQGSLTDGQSAYSFSSPDQLKIAAAGDINLDGFNDVLINDLGTGTTYILYGSPGLPSHQEIVPNISQFFATTKGTTPSNQNTALKPAFDSKSIQFNGIFLDSATDRLLSYDPNMDKLPYYGGAMATQVNGISQDSPDRIKSGVNLSSGGDFNGDGFSDFFVSSIDLDRIDQQIKNPGSAPISFTSFIVFGGDFTHSQSQLGTIGQDVLAGTPFNDVLSGREGNDILKGEGGADALFGGSGNDVLMVNDDRFIKLDGGFGIDRLILQGLKNQEWNLIELAHRITNIEEISIENYGHNSLKINAVAQAKITGGGGQLTIIGDDRASKPLQAFINELSHQARDLTSNTAARNWLDGVVKRLGQETPGYGDMAWIYLAIADSAWDLILKDFLPNLPQPDWTQEAKNVLIKALSDASESIVFDYLPRFDSLAGSIETWINGRLVPQVIDFLATAIPSSNAPDNDPLNTSPNASTDDLEKQLDQYFANLSTTFTKAEDSIGKLPKYQDTIYLSSDYRLIQSGLTLDSGRYSYYGTANGQTISIPDSVLAVIDPSLPTTLSPKPIWPDISSRSVLVNTSLPPVTSSDSEEANEQSDSSVGIHKKPILFVDAPKVREDERKLAVHFTLSHASDREWRVGYQLSLDDRHMFTRERPLVSFAPGETHKTLYLEFANKKPKSKIRDIGHISKGLELRARLMAVPKETEAPSSPADPPVSTPEPETPSSPLKPPASKSGTPRRDEKPFNLIRSSQINDILTGTRKADLIYGSAGNDKLYGRRGDDILFGRKGSDILYGGRGNDQLNGGRGNDILRGGKGADRFILSRGNDQIMDFSSKQRDQIVIGSSRFNSFDLKQDGSNVIVDLFNSRNKLIGQTTIHNASRNKIADHIFSDI